METNSEYKTAHGIIQDPGKFEGEPVAIPDYWYQCLAGAYDEDLIDSDYEAYYVIYLDDEDRTRLNLGKGQHDETFALVMWEDEQGYVYHEIMTKDQYAEFMDDIELAWESDDYLG